MERFQYFGYCSVKPQEASKEQVEKAFEGQRVTIASSTFHTTVKKMEPKVTFGSRK